jgi:hypothetical protein
MSVCNVFHAPGIISIFQNELSHFWNARYVSRRLPISMEDIRISGGISKSAECFLYGWKSCISIEEYSAVEC